MARVNQTTDGVFSKFYGDDQTIPAFDAFLERNNPDNPSNNLKKYVKSYKDYVTKEKLYLERISVVEELIMQLRAKENLEDIKISFVRDYIYARCPFYRRDKASKDVRVIVDNKEFWKLSLKKLVLNEEFMEKAKDKLGKQMVSLISVNMAKLARLDAAIEKHEEKLKAAAKQELMKELAKEYVLQPKVENKEPKVENLEPKEKPAKKQKVTKQKETVQEQPELVD